MAEWFKWCPDSVGVSKRHTYQLQEVKFEDYTQTIQRGVRPIRREYSLRFRRSTSEINEILGWLDAHVGQTFLMDDPLDGRMIRVRSGDPSVSIENNRHVLSVDLIGSPQETA